MVDLYKQTALNLAVRHAPRSSIETRLKRALAESRERHISILVRSHNDKITRNVKADARTVLE